jgi:allantoate deiminase
MKAPPTSSEPNGARILALCDELARHSSQPNGLTRMFLSREQAAVSQVVLGWMRDVGMSARIDAIGNVVGRYEGTQPGLPALVLGSHLDTVRDAGKYDGPLGVVAAIECVRALHARGKRFDFAIEIYGFADEEGVRFGATLLGSRAVAGTFRPANLDTRDRSGLTMRQAMEDAGLDPDQLPAAIRRRDEVLAYVELHIEQGPVLEAHGLPLGIVTAINGQSRYQIEIAGMAGHAGTVPMGSLRRDALAGAAECVLAVERICGAVPDLVGTVGTIEALPGAVNVIPGRARFTIDVRSPHDDVRRRAVGELLSAFASICEQRHLSLSNHVMLESRVAQCAPWLMAQFEAALIAEGVAVRRLPSGAGHDGLAMIDLTDIGMLFVRCKGGISHHPAESVTEADAAVGTRVLLRFVENFRPAAARAAA